MGKMRSQLAQRRAQVRCLLDDEAQRAEELVGSNGTTGFLKVPCQPHQVRDLVQRWCGPGRAMKNGG